MPHSRSDQWPVRSEVPATLAQFYREEFLKHQKCLERQREYYSERAISNVQAALTRILAELEQLCCKQDADLFVSELLRQFDVVTGLSAWSDPKEVH